MPLELMMGRKPELLKDIDIVWGEAPSMLSLNRMVSELARTEIPFLVMGESGSGKEVYAKAIHELGTTEISQFRKLSCDGLDSSQLHRELETLQHPSSETDRTNTLFLDEIDGMSHENQRVLLSFISTMGIRGESRCKVRLISSTTNDLEKEIEAGRFRRELYFRLNGACLRLPPLRERLEDLGSLLTHFLNRQEAELKKQAPELNAETMEVLLSYHWPGNIRELENVARKMVALGETTLAIADLRVSRTVPHQGEPGSGRLSSLKVAARAASRQTERELILQALERTKWNRKRAARELQISYKSLLYKLKQIETLGTKSEK
jgi:two-component system, NtrC family, response regulator AtoC